MRIPGMKTLRLGGRWVRSQLVNSALILGYHRIIDVPCDPFSMCVKPGHFAEHLEVLRKHACPISLEELVLSMKKNRVPRKAVAITFDDGYADNLHNAKPLLERYQIPATVFIVPGNLGREFWWDELTRILSSPARLPERLSLTADGCRYKWAVVDGGDKKQRQRLLVSLYKFLRPSPKKELQAMIAKLRDWSGSASKDLHSYYALKSEELNVLAEGDLVEIGAHTMTHPVLSHLSVANQQAEIQNSKLLLEELLGRPVRSFSYPHGHPSAETMRIVRDSGFHCACTSFNDVVWRGSDRFHLPRFWIPDWDGEKFSRWLRKWLHG